MSATFDLTIVGGGIIGLATAMQAAQAYPKLKIVLLEKERELAQHQTGHNSGVIHAGIYYRPGSLKAQTCVSGRNDLLRFCDENGIPYELCGKVVVATDRGEIPRLEELQRRGLANGVPGLEMIGPERLKEIEPHANGIQALYSPATGIIDFSRVTQAYAVAFQSRGGQVKISHQLRRVMERDNTLVLETSAGEVRSRYLVNCAGLFVDHVARMVTELRPELRIVPFRGEYYTLVPERRYLVNGLIYPVPDPRFPFLGVHFTRRIQGGIEAGPNAVLALAREGYRKSTIRAADAWKIFSYMGFWALAGKYWRTGLEETYRSFNKGAFVKALQRLVPEIRKSDLASGGAGVRAQAVSATGDLLDDFVIRQTNKAIHVLNAPSPGATASLSIGKQIVGMAGASFGLGSH